MAAGRVLADPQLRAVKDLNQRCNRKNITFCRFLADSIPRTGATGRETLLEGRHIYNKVNEGHN
jgi:hypothetical protein